MATQRCKYCREPKGRPHRADCQTRSAAMSSYPDSAVYTTATDSGSSWDGGCSSASDTGSSSSSDSSGGGGGDCG